MNRPLTRATAQVAFLVGLACAASAMAATTGSGGTTPPPRDLCISTSGTGTPNWGDCNAPTPIIRRLLGLLGLGG